MSPKNLYRAYEIMLKQTTIGSKEIKEIFEVTSPSSVHKAKQPVFKKMAEDGMGKNAAGYGRVYIKIAYPVWGLQEDDLERRYAKARKHKLIGEVSS